MSVSGSFQFRGIDPTGMEESNGILNCPFCPGCQRPSVSGGASLGARLVPRQYLGVFYHRLSPALLLLHRISLPCRGWLLPSLATGQGRRNWDRVVRPSPPERLTIQIFSLIGHRAVKKKQVVDHMERGTDTHPPIRELGKSHLHLSTTLVQA